MEALSIDQLIQGEINKIPQAMRDNFLVRATINSREELGPEGQLDQLRDINRYARRRQKTEDNTVQLKPARLFGSLRAGKKKGSAPVTNRKAK
jgi:hypothetical protein